MSTEETVAYWAKRREEFARKRAEFFPEPAETWAQRQERESRESTYVNDKAKASSQRTYDSPAPEGLFWANTIGDAALVGAIAAGIAVGVVTHPLLGIVAAPVGAVAWWMFWHGLDELRPSVIKHRAMVRDAVRNKKTLVRDGRVYTYAGVKLGGGMRGIDKDEVNRLVRDVRASAPLSTPQFSRDHAAIGRRISELIGDPERWDRLVDAASARQEREATESAERRRRWVNRTYYEEPPRRRKRRSRRKYPTHRDELPRDRKQRRKGRRKGSYPRGRRKKFSRAFREQMHRDAGGCCEICGKRVSDASDAHHQKKMHIDHKQPWSSFKNKRQADRPENLRVACAPCNLSKGAKRHH